MDVLDPAQLAARHASLSATHDTDPGKLVALASEALRRAAHADAQSSLEAALIIGPELPSAWALYGELELSRSNVARARTCYERAVQLDDTDTLSAVTLAELYGQNAAADAKDKDRALALANFIALENGVPSEIIQRVSALKKNLRSGART